MRRLMLAAMLISGSAAQAQKLSIEQQLQARYPPTKLAADKLRIVTPGTVLVVQMGGMAASPLNEFAFGNNYKDGRIKRSAASALIHDAKSRDLMVGEKVYLLKTEVKDNGVVFSIQSCVACDGADIDLYQMGYRASLAFQYPKGYLETADFAQIQRDIGQVFTFAGPAPVAQAAPAAPTKISLGQTIEAVTASLGRPDKVVDLGSKKIYIYPDLKITFQDGKVSDVQ
jgi:hypothetical protein